MLRRKVYYSQEYLINIQRTVKKEEKITNGLQEIIQRDLWPEKSVEIMVFKLYSIIKLLNQNSEQYVSLWRIIKRFQN